MATTWNLTMNARAALNRWPILPRARSWCWGQLEEKQHIKERILEAAQYVPLDRLCLSPQCGFASTEEGNKLTEADQWKKLALIREIAEEIWG